MNSIRNIETEVLKVYDTWLHSYLNGDVGTYDAFLDDAFHFIGSTHNEEFLDRENTTAFFEATAQQFAGKSQLRNETKIVEQLGDLIFITHLFDAWFIDGADWKFYSRFRFSNALRKSEAGWRFVYQHYSIPDSKAQKGQTIGFEQVSNENLQLREAIKRRTVELEAKNRELEIEGALERLRARSMAMQHSEELSDIAQDFHEHMLLLGINSEFSYVWLPNEKKGEHLFWATWKEDKNGKGLYHTRAITYPLDTLEPYTATCLKDWHSGTPVHEHFVPPGEIEHFFASWEELLEGAEKINAEHFPDGIYYTEAFMKYGCFGIDIRKPLGEDQKRILNRFAKEFERTYTRFLDLQKAEAQAREAQIQLALERIRARTMAMQHSDELVETSELLFQQIKGLGIELWSCGYSLWFDDDSYFIGYNPMPNGKMGPTFKIPLTEDIFFRTIRKAKREGKEFLVFESKGKSLIKTYEYMDTLPVVGEAMRAIVDAGFELPKYQVTHCGFFTHGHLMFITHKHYPEAHDIFKRFTKEFQQTYTRFLDLQKAEAQAWEAKIESSLEKIRNVALSLKSSDEMLDIAQVLYEQLKILGFHEIRNALIDINDEKTETFMDYDYSDLMGGTVTQMAYDDDPTLKEQLQDIAKTTDGYSEMMLEGQQLQDLINMRRKNGEADDPRLEAATGVSYILYAFGNGAIGISNFGKLTENQKAVLNRFRNVFTFAYNRYSELAKAEDQMREVQLEASLEKVRSVALSMQKPDDMLDIAKILYEQLQELGFSEIRNAIIDLHNEDNETFWDYDYSEAMGGTITLLSYKNDPTLEKQYRKIVSTTDGFYEEIIEGNDLRAYVEMRIRNGEQDDPRLRKVDLLSYYLYSFGNGVIGISNFGILNDKQKEVLERFRNVFTFAYKRYQEIVQAQEYLTNLQEAKRGAENALNELQTTQQQLIQAEKMASLGELTAGIAHEIQNPLNFVNNFSEVSTELLEELEEEIDHGSVAEVKLLLRDIRQNLEKITQHGKRADGIVKGMLQHSRKTTGEKTPTDLNALCDEYLRLSYHGLRAADKTFNATLKTEFDDTIGKINLVPQDIGRVILNLLTNAFYACSEKGRQLNGRQPFEPTVCIATKRNKETIEISISDNGNGIPKAVREKIFQPFFTTKPTGQGTGLGLSMSYDIITKAHKGELRMVTQLGEGSTFTIILPNSNLKNER